MTQKSSEQKTKGGATKGKAEEKKPWRKPRITRHGNMRQLTQMSA